MLQATINEKSEYNIEQKEEGWYVNGNEVNFELKALPNGLVSILLNDHSYTAILEAVDRKTKEVRVNIDGKVFNITLKEPIDQLLNSMGMDLKAMQKVEPVKAPMPGMILKVLVEPGQEINKGDGLVILEAMKMENILKASGAAKVKSIKVEEKTAVEKGVVLIELE